MALGSASRRSHALSSDSALPRVWRAADCGCEAILSRLPPNRDPDWLSLGKRTYPNGYAIEDLGHVSAAAAEDAPKPYPAEGAR